ncbi:hypothetical protein AB0H43_02035 [Hamadaea sp. NPDC050747]|uniref:hypothetical protein n=1 Tax=Hamadaea sp. NPDC050747 TaxID=3155789 RepID=UPI0033E7D9E3
MIKPPNDPNGPTRIRVYENPHALVEITGPTEAAVLRKAAEWLETLDDAVVVLGTNWRGDIGELTQEPDVPLYKLDLTVDISIAVTEGRWPRDWFQG